jgi:hypothetical protein
VRAVKKAQNQELLALLLAALFGKSKHGEGKKFWKFFRNFLYAYHCLPCCP